MPLYDEETFDKSLIPSHFKQDVKEILEIAAMLGWKVHVTGAQSVTIIAPGERKKYHFGRRNSTPLNRVRRDIVRFGDPEKVALAGMLAHGDENTARAASVALPLLGEEGTVEDNRPETEEETEQVHSVKPEPTVISSRPMVAKAREGLGYDSPTTIERKWSDGTTDYRCISCDYTSPNRGSVPAHHGKAHAVTTKPSMFKADVPDARVYAPRQNRIDALADELLAAFEGDTLTHSTVEEMARKALSWVHEQTKNKTRFAPETEPMSAEDALDRIRLLLDDGSQQEARRRQVELEERVVALTTRVEAAENTAAEMEERARTAEKRASQARSTLKAFTDLATELATDEQEAG